MSDINKNSDLSISLKPKARLLKTLGEELISSETVALIELVKNAYDADAKNVLIKFSGDIKVGAGSVTIFVLVPTLPRGNAYSPVGWACGLCPPLI